MAKVGIVMGSDSDLKIMSKAADMLDKFGIEYEMTIISAHRMPDKFFEYAKSAEEKDYKVIIAGAGMAAHLPGMCAAIFPMPVIGVPMSGKNLDGMDALQNILAQILKMKKRTRSTSKTMFFQITHHCHLASLQLEQIQPLMRQLQNMILLTNFQF